MGRKYVSIDFEETTRKKIIIVSDGYKFSEKQQLLSKLSSDVSVIGVNKALAKWRLVGEKVEAKKAMAFYVINNPYPEAQTFQPTNSYYPKCIASVRTHPPFLNSYKGNIYSYAPVPEKNYLGPARDMLLLDDYRNPICAAIGISHHFKAKKVMLFCCDGSFDDERPGAEKLDNGLWSYPQQKKSNSIIDGCLHWLRQAGVSTADFSNGPKFQNADYINNEEEMIDFFNG
jgi:hypothetical protein